MVRSSVFKRLAVVSTMTLVALTAAACGGDDSSTAGDGGDGGDGGGTDIGVILPDATTSPRWEANDKPSLSAAFDAAGVELRHPERPGQRRHLRPALRPDGRRGPGADDRQPRPGVGQGVPRQGDRRRHPEHRLRPADPGRRRVLLRVVRQRGRRRSDGRGSDRGASTRPARPRPTSSTSTVRPPTTTPRCSSRATRRRSPTRSTRATTRSWATRAVSGTPPRPVTSSSRCSPTTAARSTASCPPTTPWPAASSPV